MAGGTIIITGANGTLGLALVQQLTHAYPTQHKQLLLVRDASPTDAHTARLRARAPASAEIHGVDLNSLSAVRAFASTVEQRIAAGELPRVRAVVCSAMTWAIAAGPYKYSNDGFEGAFQTTYLAHFLLVMRLLGSMDVDSGARVVFLGSASHGDGSFEVFPRDEMEMRQLVSPPEPRASGTEMKDGIKRYGLAKMCVIAFMHSLNARLVADPQLSSITVLAMDPLTMPSSRAFAKGPLFMAVVMNYLLVWLVPLFQYFSNVSTPAASARDLMEFTVGPAGERKRGYYKRMVETTSSPESYSPELWERVWKASVEWTNLEAGDTALAEWR